ncbi:MAG TPA: nucleotide exchange factor GrpE [Acidobacteriota bacterium]|nr:nucleotide exchange factor GrpE [Acidobacteriota bacterium]
MMNRQNQDFSERDELKQDAGGRESDASAAAEAVESVAAPGDPMAQLRADLAAARTETAEWQDRFLRRAAEMENYRKRVEKEKADSREYAQSAVLLEFLPVADACERALKIFEESKDANAGIRQYREGVELLYQQMLNAFKRTGAEVMKTQGKEFDPHLHEALSREETAEYEEGTVVREVRQGYLFKDRLLRPAQVIVAVRPQSRNSNE